MKWLFNECRRHEAGLSLLAAGVLPEGEQKALSVHLAGCATCRAKLEGLQKISTGLAGLGENLPQVEAPVALRQRWMAAVRESAAPQRVAPDNTTPSAEGFILSWLTGRRLALGSLAATWALVLFFRFSAPEVAQPAMAAAQIPSLREVLMVLKVDRREPPFQVEANDPVRDTHSPTGAMSPRSQGSRMRLEELEVA